jgi:hypothetical protein
VINTEALAFPTASVGDTEVALLLKGRSEFPGLTPGTRATFRNTINLARPWKFPAGRVDSIPCRRHSRSIVEVPVEIILSRPDGSPYDRGTGVIRDLSYSGLRLGDIFLVHGRLLAMYFGVELRPALESPGRCLIAGRILRTFSLGFPGFGIEFLAPGSGAEARLRKK